MKTHYFLWLIIPLAALIACEPTNDTKQGDVDQIDSNVRILSSDLQPNCWFNENTLQKEVYHTQPWASKLDSTWTDSYGFRSSFSDLGKGIPKSINIGFWGLFTNPKSDTKLVIGIDSVTTQVFWAGIDLKDSVKEANVWREFNYTMVVPPNLRPDDRLTVYVWSFDKQLLYVDDLKISLVY